MVAELAANKPNFLVQDGLCSLVLGRLFKGGGITVILWHCYGSKIARCKAHVKYLGCRRWAVQTRALQTERGSVPTQLQT